MNNLQYSSSQPSKAATNTRPFPAVTGGCFCTKTRYRLDAPPLFCYSCHCPECQKHTGSVFACMATIEIANITYGTNPPTFTKNVRSGLVRTTAACDICGTQLWATDGMSPVTADIKVGTLDHPELMEPDMHSFVESRIPWVGLPEGARTCERAFDFREVWPRSSLRRFDEAVRKSNEETERNEDGVVSGAQEEDGPPQAQGMMIGADGGEEVEAEGEETDTTPTAQSPDEEEEEEREDDDEEYEKRARATELALLERLEKLTLKLEQQKPESS